MSDKTAEAATLAVIGGEEDLERAAFEAWFRKEVDDRGWRLSSFKKFYNEEDAQRAWEAWQARAKLNQFPEPQK